MPKITEGTAHCDKHGVFHQRTIHFTDGSTSALNCPACDAENNPPAPPKSEEQVRMERQEGLRQSMLLRLRCSGIPERFLERTLEGFHAECERAADARDICKEYVENFEAGSKKGRSLIFTGKPGTGKTHLACGIANALVSCGWNPVFIRVSAAIRRVKDTYRKNSTETEQEAIEQFKRPDLLILDEVGVQFGSEAEKLILFEIINERYEAMRPTILISNLNLDGLKQYVGERVVDRLRENGGKLMVFDWQSHRGKGA